MRLRRQARLLVLHRGLVLALTLLAPPVPALPLDLDPAPDRFLPLPQVEVLAALAPALLLLNEKGSILYLNT